jgi:hypothetical protein
MIRRCIICGRPKVQNPQDYEPGEGAHLCWTGDDLLCDAADPMEELAKLRAIEDAVAKFYLAATAFPEDVPDGMRDGYISTIYTDRAATALLDLYAKQKADRGY